MSKSKNYLEKIPFDYYDFFHKNYAEGRLRLGIAQDLRSMGLDGLSFIFETLAKENLLHMKAIANIPEPRKRKKKTTKGRKPRA